ncbi:MAG TPA: hypothetical protein VHP54_01480 [Caproiciproducens sp.]|nr:hypothetical protein [Caproiciproducens sp.]
MKEFTASGHYFNIGEFKKILSCQGSSNCDLVCFWIDRYCESTDLSQCSCTIKTKNSAGKSDVILPEIQTLDDKIKVLWSISSASTSVSGKLLVQIQFEKIFDDHTKNIVWQSNIMEFMIPDSLNSADEVFDQRPTLFQQWEEKVNAAYSDVSVSVKAVQALQSQAKSYSEAAGASAQTSEQQAAFAKADADRAQQTAAGLECYTKKESSNVFANAFTGSASGLQLTLDDVQPNTNLRSLLLNGLTYEIGTGTKSPDNPCTLTGTTQVTVSDGASQSQVIAAPQTLYSLPNDTCDTYEVIGGLLTQKIGKIVLNGSETWNIAGEGDTTAGISFYTNIHGMKSASIAIVQHECDRFQVITYGASKVTPKPVNFLTAQTTVIIVNIERSKLTTQDTAGFKKWLAANPVTVLYQLAAPVFTLLSKQTVSAYAPDTVIAADRGTLTAQYNRDSNAVLKKLQSAIQALGGNINS